jgi:hypothetical protein
MIVDIPAEYVDISPGHPEAKVRVDIPVLVYSSTDLENMPIEFKPKEIDDHYEYKTPAIEIKESPAFSPMKTVESVNDSIPASTKRSGKTTKTIS